MRQNLEQLFVHLNQIEPPVGLFLRLLNRLGKEKQLRAIRRQLMILTPVLIGAFAALALTFQSVQASFYETGFYQFISLLFSDFSIVVVYWQNFALSLLETLPVTGLIVFLTTLLVFLSALRLFARDIKIIFASKQLINC